MNPDSPICIPSQDKFGYTSLADQVAPVLILSRESPSFIAGVESRWGSGKTSFLNLTRRALARSGQNVLLFDYRPWLYSTADALLLGFCVQIAAQLQGQPGRKYEAASKALIREVGEADGGAAAAGAVRKGCGANDEEVTCD